MGAVDRLSARSTLPFHTDPRRFHAPTCRVAGPPREYASLQCGLNQAELAKRVGVTQAYIAMLEKGDKVNPTLALLAELVK
jgi:helix-turn-helix protein